MEIMNLLKTLLLSFFPVIYITGIIGNIFSLYIFSKKKFKNTIFEIYFRLLNVTYMLALSYVIFDYMNFQFDYNLEIKSPFSCKIIYYIYFTFPPIGSWILVIISLNIMICVLYPLRFRQIRNSKRIQIVICLIIIVYNFCFYIEIIFKQELNIPVNDDSNETNQTGKTTHLECNSNEVIYWMDFFNSAFLPSILMIIFTTIMIKQLIKSRLKLSKKDIRFMFVSIFLNVFFLISNLPIVIFNFIRNYTDIHDEMSELIFILVIIPYYVSFADVFFISFFINKYFKNEVLKLLRFIFNSKVTN